MTLEEHGPRAMEIYGYQPYKVRGTYYSKYLTYCKYLTIVRPLNPWFHSLDLTNLRSCGPGAFLLKKSLYKWTPWFTPMLFKGQLYYYSFCLGSRIK